MKKLSLTALVLVLLVGVVAFMAYADAPTRGNGPGAPGFNNDGPHGPMANDEPFIKKLNLTADQQTKILAIRQDFEKNSQPFRFIMQTEQLELRQLWSADQLNQNAIKTVTDQLITAKIKVVTLSREMFNQIKSILTPEQQKLLPNKDHPLPMDFGVEMPGPRCEERSF
ncbi:MAG TPA: hypothetical protein DDW50_17950 [Firmicutes bacterium]|jgi:Spy/CpxP family protein refolding chaperone|nr:hypothetical protein [Bacillota bacterium]